MAPKAKEITVVKNYGGRRAQGAPQAVADWSIWQCDPKSKPRAPTRLFAYGKEFPWHFDMLEKAYVLEGSATLTADDPAAHGDPVTIEPKDMVTFPKGWRGRWEVHSLLRKHYAFFDGKGLRVDEASDDEDEDEDEDEGNKAGGKRGAAKDSKPAAKKGKQS